MTPPPTLNAADSVSGDGPHEVVVAGPFERVHVLDGLWLSDKDTKLTVRAGRVIIRFLALNAAAPPAATPCRHALAQAMPALALREDLPSLD